MIDVVAFLAAPFSACLILVGMLGYLGIHVLRRKVIFVDLALAQFAAMGTVIGIASGFEAGSPQTFGFSLAAATLGAAIFAGSRSRHPTVPQEAIIGITYVIASALTILLADRTPEGAEHIKELLAGAILWVSWPTVIKVLIVCLVVGGAHLLMRQRFILISEDPERAYCEGLAVRWWDFIFYLSFGVVITVAVEIAGVLMVFAYLVAPAIIALASSNSWRQRIAIAWVVGLIASAAGLLASYQWDLPSGPAVVCILGVMLLGFAFGRRLIPGLKG